MSYNPNRSSSLARLAAALSGIAGMASAQENEKCFGVALAGPERLRGGRRHHLRRDLEGRLSGQRLEAGSGWHLRNHGTARRRRRHGPQGLR